MTTELDHLFICVSAGAEEASVLAAFGLKEGKPNVHPGQGTACRRFCLRNGYIELVWVNNETVPESWSFQVATNAALVTEPMLFYLPFLQRADARPGAERQQVKHKAGLREITRVEMSSPCADSVSPALTAAVSAGLIRMRPDTEYLVEVGFDGEALGRVADCRPSLPLVLRW